MTIDNSKFGILYAGPRGLPGGEVTYVMPLLLGRARINVGDPDFVRDSY